MGQWPEADFPEAYGAACEDLLDWLGALQLELLRNLPEKLGGRPWYPWRFWDILIISTDLQRFEYSEIVRYGDHLQDMRCFKILNMWPWIARRFCPSRLFFFVWGNKLAGRKCTHLCLEAHDILRGFWKKGLNMSKLLETWYGCSQSNFAPCAPLVTAYLLADLILLINNNQQSLSGLLTEVCAFVKFGRLSLEQHLDGELWQAWKWERLRKMGRSVCSVLLVFNWFTRWVPVGVLWSMFTVWFGDKITCM